MIRKLGLLTAFVTTGMLSFAISVQAAEGQPSPWQLGLQAAGDERIASNPLLAQRPEKRILLLLVTSDKGLSAKTVRRVNSEAKIGC